MMDLSALLAFLPEPARTYVVAALYAFLATQIVASAIVAKLPAEAFRRWRPLRVLSWYATLAPRDAAGTIKLPFTTPQDPGAMRELERLRRAVEAIGQSAAPLLRETQAPPAPREGERGSARVGTLLALCLAILVACGLGALLTGCPPVPPSDGGTPVVTPSGWSQTARLAVTVGRGLLPVAGAIVEATTQDPGRTQARRAFVVADDALAGLGRALDAYDARGGDRCAAYAAAGAAGVALAELADVLAANGIALGVPLGRVVDLVASVVDTLVPQCQLDAGFASAGRAANDRLLGIERAARSRGVILRRDLDAIEPRIDGGVR